MASVKKLANGNYQVRWRDPNNRACKKTFKRKVDADNHRVSMDHTMRDGTYVDPGASKITFKAYAERWRIEQRQHRPSTAQQIESNLRRHVYPAIGDLPLGRVHANDIRAIVSRMTNGDGEMPGLSPRTVKVTYTWVSTIFKCAVGDRVLARSPCQGIKLPSVDEKRVEPLTLEVVLKVTEAMPARYRALVTLGATTGVRISEAMGLTVDRINFLKRTVLIDRQLTRGQGTGPCFGPVKDKRNRPRTIPLPEATVQALASHLAEWPPGESGLVFTSQSGGPLRRTTFSDVWRKAAQPLGIPKGDGFHQLRHFYASLLIQHGESVKVVQERLGHQRAELTLDTYSHLWPETDDATRAAVDSVFSDQPVGDEAVLHG